MRHHPAANCEECPLREVGRYSPSEPPTYRDLGPQVAIVGEMPAARDYRSGHLFSGEAGRLLDIILNHHAMDRKDMLLTNAVMCRPPDNEPPTHSAIVACRPRLIQELQENDIDTVVALGNSATEAVLGKSGVQKLRMGPPKYGTILPGVRIIPTINPAAALRQADQFPNIVSDIAKVRYAKSDWTEPDYIVADDEINALDLLSQLDTRLSTSDAGTESGIVIDIEIDVEKDTSFDIPSKYGMLCVGIGYAPNRVLVLGERAMAEQSVRVRLGELLDRYRIVAQNGKFDLKGLQPIVGVKELWFDTMLASYVFDERQGGIHGLKYQAQELLGAPDYEAEIKRYVGPGVGYGAIPRDKLYKYNAVDVACTYELWQMYERRFSDDPSGEELRRVHDHLVAASNQLMYVELNGIYVDRTYINELNVAYIDSLHQIEDEIDEIIHHVNYDNKRHHKGINPRSPMQVKKYLADKQIEVASTDAATIEYLYNRTTLPQDFDEVHAFCGALLKHRKEAKLHGTYVKGMLKRMYHGRLYSTFLLHGSTTGRLASRNPNMQNIPRGPFIRKMFIPVPNEERPNKFLQTDYAQAELRVLSYLAGDTYFRDIFNAGDIDVFDDLSAILYPGKTKELVGPDEWKELRIRVKAFVYGLNYGREAGSIAKEFGLEMKEAFRLKNEFFEVIPEIVQFQAETKKKVLAGEDLITPWGRHRRFTLITKENKHDIMNEALAFLPQSTASDMCLRALYLLRPQIKGLGHIRNIVHDSLLVEGPEENMPELQRLTELCMIEAAEYIVGDYVKFAVDSKIGNHWGEV